MKTKEIKNYPWKISLILGMLILILPGCLDIRITTQINPNGSLRQTIVFKGDSTEIAEVQFAFMKESDWKREWAKLEKEKRQISESKEVEKDQYQLTVSKEFKSVSDLNKSMNPADTSMQSVRINATLHRKFRWFYTNYIYSETVLNSNPFKGLDYHAYLTNEDVRLMSLSEETRKADPGYDSTQYKEGTDKRFEEFLYRSMFETFYRELTGVLAQDKSLTLRKQDLDAKKDVLYRFLIDSVKNDKTDDLLAGVDRVINHPDIRIIRSKYLSKFDSFQRKMKFYESANDDSYKFAIRMPGLLLQTNSPKIEASETGWELTYYDFFFKDYTMTAESRRVNTWAFIVAGFVLLVALGSMITALLRKRY